jgi:hypothetical protein
MARTTRQRNTTRCPSRFGHSAASVRGGKRTAEEHAVGASSVSGAVVLASDGTPEALGPGASGEGSGASDEDEDDAAEARASQAPQRRVSATVVHDGRTFRVIAANYAGVTPGFRHRS